MCNRKFRRRDHQMLAIGYYDRLLLNLNEVMNEWELDGDGKHVWFFSSEDYARGEEWYNYYLSCMRK